MSLSAADRPLLDWLDLALAVLGPADVSLIAACLARNGGPALVELDEQALANHPGLQVTHGLWRLDPAQTQHVLGQLDQSDPALYRQLHQAALVLLADRLRQGEGIHETPFVLCLDRLANRLTVEEPGALARLIEAVADVPLLEATHQHLMVYFEGLALGFQERYGDAIGVFDALLATPDLDENVQGRTLNARAVFCRLTGRLQEAVDNYRASLQIWQRLGETRREGIAQLNLGILAYTLREYDEAHARLILQL